MQDETIYYLYGQVMGGGGAGPEPPITPPVSARTGPVRLEHRCFVDDQGGWNPLAASLFWSLWGEKNDPERLDKNLAHLAAHAVDYVRILGMVGTESWADRVIDPFAPDYWPTVDKLIDRVARHGLRLEATLFADAQVMMPHHSDRRNFARQWATKVEERRAQFQMVEGANEGWQNGFPETGDDVDPNFDAIRELARDVRNISGIPIALTSMLAMPGHDIANSIIGSDAEVQRWLNDHEYGYYRHYQQGLSHDDQVHLLAGIINCRAWGRGYADSAANIATVHYDRDKSKGEWRPVRQPWGWAAEYEVAYEGMLPTGKSNEPIGPQSSVVEEWDPIRLAMSYVTAFISGNASYVYHTGAGVRGGGQADLDRGRYSNVYDYPPEILTALKAMRLLLPPGVSNWTRHNSQWASMPWNGFQTAVENGTLERGYAATSGNLVVLALLGQKADITVQARSGYRLSRHDPRNGDVLSVEDVPAGAHWTVPATLSGSVFLGQALSQRSFARTSRRSLDKFGDPL